MGQSNEPKMNPEWKDKWVKALRSGKYRKGFTRMRSYYDTYCPLGVLCDIVDPKGWQKEFNGYKHHYRIGLPSRHVASKVGIELPPDESGWCPKVPYNHQLVAITALNDGRDLTFKQIADLIEAYL